MSEQNSTAPLIFLELNEINFELIQKYIELGYLPNFQKLLDKFALHETTVNLTHEQLEPWIQWVSVHTGKSFDEHQVFKLGDITERDDLRQHWEVLEEQGYSVGAFSPMNAANRTKDAKFWLPHPFVETPVSGENWLSNLKSAMKESFNYPTPTKLSTKAKTTLGHILLTKTQKTQWPSYLTNAYRSLFKQCHWAKALIIDRLLADSFIQQWKKYQPDFSTLYMRAGAFFQRHYWFNSKAYEGSNHNPIWYVQEDSDPVLDILQMYDQIVADLFRLPARVIIATGLRQVPHEQVTYNYRIEDRDNLLANLRVNFKSVTPHHESGFYIECESQSAAEKAERTLRQLFSENDEPLFDFTKQEGQQLYAQLTYPYEIKSPFPVKNAKGEIVIEDFATEVCFVTIVNSHHDKTGYYIDSDVSKEDEHSSPICVEELYQIVMNHFASEEKQSASESEKRTSQSLDDNAEDSTSSASSDETDKKTTESTEQEAASSESTPAESTQQEPDEHKEASSAESAETSTEQQTSSEQKQKQEDSEQKTAKSAQQASDKTDSNNSQGDSKK